MTCAPTSSLMWFVYAPRETGALTAKFMKIIIPANKITGMLKKSNKRVANEYLHLMCTYKLSFGSY